MKKNLKVGVITDGKYGERAFANINKNFDAEWIVLPEIPSNIMLDDDIELEIPDCDIYISYARHPDIILELAELQRPLILGILPGIGLLNQARNINKMVIHAPTMCSLENDTGINEIDEFTTLYGRPLFEPKIDDDGIFKEIKVTRSSLCGSSEAGADFLLNKKFNEENLQNFALSVCYECRAPRFGHTCDKEVAGINHLVSLLNAISPEVLSQVDDNLEAFIISIRKQFKERMDNSRILLDQIIKN